MRNMEQRGTETQKQKIWVFGYSSAVLISSTEKCLHQPHGQTDSNMHQVKLHHGARPGNFIMLYCSSGCAVMQPVHRTGRVCSRKLVKCELNSRKCVSKVFTGTLLAHDTCLFVVTYR